MNSTVRACLGTKEAYADVLNGATSFDEKDYLTNNFKNGMVVDTV